MVSTLNRLPIEARALLSKSDRLVEQGRANISEQSTAGPRQVTEDRRVLDFVCWP